MQRTRSRPEALNIDRQKIADRVIRLYEASLQSRTDEEQARIQRYAKYRLWTEQKDWPWEDASNIPLPDMTEKSLRLQDTLHNAVMSQRPPIGSKALDKSNKDKEQRIDKLIDYQVFVEQPGEKIIGDLADQFVNDGVFTAFIPWVTEQRQTSDLRLFDPIPAELQPDEYFSALVSKAYPNDKYAQIPKNAGWDWTIKPDGGKRIDLSFYTRKSGDVEMVARGEVTVYDGPCVIPYAWADVFHPPRAANLQMPSPSNKGGAAFVVLRDPTVTVNEIFDLSKGDDPFYDLMTQADIDRLPNQGDSGKDTGLEGVKDDLQGVSRMPTVSGAESHKTLTRLMCFDLYDIDGDGVDEDVVWWVLLETKTLMRARRLTEVYPAMPPRRPLAEAAFLPIEGRRGGMSLLEIMEGLHDATKSLMDQTVDSGTLKTVPFGFYRAAGGLRPEVIRMWPGELYPLNDPKNDIYFPQFSTNSEGLQINLVTMLQGMGERLTTIGDLNFGRVPAGKASALRTAAGISMISSQGEARPERILRRFFMGLCEIWGQIHELNQVFLPKDKQFRIVGYQGEGKELFGVVENHDQIKGRFSFDFSANVLNTSKSNLQQALMTLSQVFISQVAIQTGITKPDNIYRLFRDVAQAWGQDPDKYISAPDPDAMMPRIFAEEAVSAILNDNMPEGRAAEAGGEMEHFQKLLSFTHNDGFGFLSEPQVEMFREYLAQCQKRAVAEQQQQQLMQAAQSFGQQGGAGPIMPGAASQQLPVNPQTQPMLASGNELMDESLPTAGGGGAMA